MNPSQRIAFILKEQPVNTIVEVHGWIRTRRDAGGELSFLEVSDGSCLAGLQVVADGQLPNYHTEIRKLSTGCSVRIRGMLVNSPAKGQSVELQAEEVRVYGWASPDTYPLQKKRHSFEYLRSIAHLRPRTNSLAAVARVRSHLSQATHDFFRQNGFFYVHTPIITTSDCEGAGEVFTVTNLDLNQLPRLDNKVDFSQDFFGRQAGLTVSGQLEAEVYALALGKVYTFGPTFRAENSNTSRHLAEFWMIEPEMAFCDLEGDMEVAESFLKFLVDSVLHHCAEDLELFHKFIDKELLQRLELIRDSRFARLSYSEAVALLQKAGHAFQYPVQWGADLQSEHERFLTEKILGTPVIVYDYPQAIKPFYMRVNDDGKTVAAMDILFPNIGEIVGGSQREERYDVLLQRMEDLGLNGEDYQWYLDLRRYGTVPHAGFGLGFERMIQLVTGMKNIREVIPFPRTPGSAAF
ncbi:MAG: asparagine--tRNA ligase [Deltaproteobacteria bacterium]